MVGYLLIHGGASTSRAWDRLLPLLPAPALAVDLPGRLDRPGDLATVTLTGGAASVAADVAASPLTDATELVVVAHSSGGLFLPAIVEALGPERVRALVLHAASVPPEGGTGLDCMQPRHAAGLRTAVEQAEAAGQALTTTPIPKAESMRTSSGEELTDEQLAFVTDPVRLVTDSIGVYFQPVRYSVTAEIPTTYVVSLRDGAVPPPLQQEMAARLPGPTKIIEVDAGHLLAVTDSEALADLILAV